MSSDLNQPVTNTGLVLRKGIRRNGRCKLGDTAAHGEKALQVDETTQEVTLGIKMDTELSAF